MVDTIKLVKVEIWWDLLSDEEKIEVYNLVKEKR